MVNVIPELEKIQVPLYELNNLLGNDSSESSSILYDLNRLAAISYSLNSDDQTALKHLEKARELIPALAKERRLGSSVDIDCREAAIAVSFYKKTPSEINFKKAADPLYRAINTLDLKSNPSSPSIMSVWRSQKAYNLLARLYLAKKDFNRALKYYNESKNIAETYDPSEEDATIQRMRAISYNGLGNTVTQRVPDRKTNKSSARVLDSLLQSIRYYRKSISIRKKVLTSKIADAWLDHEHAHTLANLSSDLMSYAKNNPVLTIEKKMEMANEAYNPMALS